MSNEQQPPRASPRASPRPSWFPKDGKFNVEIIQKGFNSYGHTKFLGMDYVDSGDDWLELCLDWREDLVADEQSGVMASAAIISLLDNATSLAIFKKMEMFKPQATMDMRVDYLRASPKGARVFGRGECYKLTSKIAFMRGIAHNGDRDDPIAHVTGTFIQTSLSQFMAAGEK